MKTRVCQKQNKNPDKFGKRGTFGFPIDISHFETLKFGTSVSFSASGVVIKKSSTILQAMYRMCLEQGTPASILIDKEEEEINDKIKEELGYWLEEAMKRLPKNQEICIFLRFRLDRSESANKKPLRTTAEVGKIVGVSQQTAHRNIERGLKKLKSDFKKNAQEKINKLKS